MHINELPHEIFSQILRETANLNQSENESFAYGLADVPQPFTRSKLTRYVRGPLSAESLRWDATSALRQVGSKWHEWSLDYCLEHVYERRWRGAERWAELSTKRRTYNLYELIENPSGLAVYRDPYGSLKSTDNLFHSIPSTASRVRRLWFNGFYTAETDRIILSITASCDHLTSVSLPWTVLRRGTVDDWVDLLNVNTGNGSPLESLELQAVCLPQAQAQALEEDDSDDALADPRVDFSALRRLKIFGNTLHKPVTDHDLAAIARTATNLEILDITNLSTISVAGMLALVKASHDTLRVLEHSPRSDDGFYHPHPGRLATGEHICELLTSLPLLTDLSISVPSACASLFSNPDVKWTGECQVRATDLCGISTHSTTKSAASTHAAVTELDALFASARSLIAARNRMHHHLSIELFFAGCIFEPAKKLVHGDFALAQISSGGQWPLHRETSTKGPYGTTGVYGKEDEGNWDAIREEEFLHAVERGWLRLE
ncbi:hypothetical protein MBLNU230_g4720t1 [Neophaeotheca triangularis]